MSYTIALNSFADNSNSIVYHSAINRDAKTLKEFSPLYTTVYKRELVHNLSYKSKSAIQKIDSFKFLDDDWDSYGADKPSDISIENSKTFIKEADIDGLAVYFTAPGRNGDVLVEYQLSNRISAEIYFNSDGSNELLIFGDSECISEGTIERNYSDLITLKDEKFSK